MKRPVGKPRLFTEPAHRTTLYLSQDNMRELSAMSFKLGKSQSDLMRAAISRMSEEVLKTS